MIQIKRPMGGLVLAVFLPLSLAVALHSAQTRISRKTVPKTVDEAVLILKTKWLSADERDWLLRTPRGQALSNLHLPFGTAVRNSFKLWTGNPALHKSCGTEDAEDCSGVIFERLWESLRADADPQLVRQLDCQFNLAEQIDINYRGFDKLTTGELLDSLQKQIDQQMESLARSGAPCQKSLRLEPTGDPNLKCFVRAEFAKEEAHHRSLAGLFGWIGWRNGFEIRHTPPTITLAFREKCAWPDPSRLLLTLGCNFIKPW